MNIPAECAEFHNEDHLSTSDIDRAGVIENLSVDMAYRHMAHEENKADPGHQRTVQIVDDSVGPRSAEQ